ncbi:Lipase, partial [Aphelenchoides avenae]
MALDFAAAAYADDPTDCLKKHGAQLVEKIRAPCDYVKDECWVYLAKNDEWIIFAARGTRTKLQLILELLESMTEPKHTFPSGGSVQHYFYTAVKAVWKVGFGKKLRQLKTVCVRPTVTFKLPGSLGKSSCAPAVHRPLARWSFSFAGKFLVRIPAQGPRVDIGHFPDYLWAAARGQPGLCYWPRRARPQVSLSYSNPRKPATVFSSWRIVHRYDLVAHIPGCYEGLISKLLRVHLSRRRVRLGHQCTPFYNHGPYHHGTEVWYPDSMVYGNDTPKTRNATSLYRICTGTPVNEDQMCSNSVYVRFSVNDHFAYFEKG